uniref:Uncharacterized protein n=1 Tax=Anguilla anguilla TaxID=7936 RepID=A0A0E9TVN4_ANGAN
MTTLPKSPCRDMLHRHITALQHATLITQCKRQTKQMSDLPFCQTGNTAGRNDWIYLH